MRVTFTASHREMAAAIDTASAKLLDWQRQVATNKRIDRASADPAAASAATVERGNLAATDRYAATADSAKSRLLVADTVLSGVVEQITSAQVTVVAARGTTMTAPQREAKALELESLRDALMQNLNTSFRGTYLFGGATATTRPFTKDVAGVVSAYQGSTLEVAVDIDDGLEVATVFNGNALARGSDTDDIFVVLQRAADATRSGDADALNTASADLERAFERATRFQSRIGTSLNAVEEDKVRLAESARANAARISALEDANMAAAVTGMTQAETVYRAALGAAAQIQRQSLMDYLR